MGKKIDISLKSCQTFSEDLEKYMGNLANTAQVFEDIVTPIAKTSGSELLLAVSSDVSEVKEAFNDKRKTAQRTAEGLREYTKKMEQINRVN